MASARGTGKADGDGLLDWLGFAGFGLQADKPKRPIKPSQSQAFIAPKLLVSF
jgi:hypothetical protein